MSITLKINPYSNVIVAPARASLSFDYFTLTNWTTDTDAEVVTDTGENIMFKQSANVSSLLINIRPYSNLIVAPEKR